MSNRRRQRKQHGSSSSEDYETDTDDDMPVKALRTLTGRKHVKAAGLGETHGTRRPVSFWSEFNQWWRQELDRLGKRPGKPSIIHWYDENAKNVWPHDTPSFQETRMHAKCLRSTEAVRDYFRRYRAARRELQHEHSDGRGVDGADDTMPPPSASKPERNCGTRYATSSPEGPAMDPATLIEQHNKRIAELQAQQAKAAAEARVPHISHPHNQLHTTLLPHPACALAPFTDAHALSFYGSSGGGSSTCVWHGPLPVQLPVQQSLAATGLCGMEPMSRSCDPISGFSLFNQASAMDCSPCKAPAMTSIAGGAGCRPMDLHSPLGAPPTPMSTCASPFKACAALIPDSDLTQALTSGGLSAREQRGGGGVAVTVAAAASGAAPAAVAAAALDGRFTPQVPVEKRRSDRSSATDDRADSSSQQHRGEEDYYDGDCEHDCSKINGEEEEDEGRARALQFPLRRSDTPLWQQSHRSVTTGLSDRLEAADLQRQQHHQQQHHQSQHQQQQPQREKMQLLQRRQQQQERPVWGLARLRQLAPPLQLPMVNPMLLTSPLPYVPYNLTGGTAAIFGGGSTLVRCGDAQGLDLLRQQQQQQQELLLRDPGPLGSTDSLSPSSLLISAPALPILPLRADDWIMSPPRQDSGGAQPPLPQSARQQPPPQPQPPPQQWQRALTQLRPQHLGGDGGGVYPTSAAAAGGGMSRIEEGAEEMEYDDDDDDDDDEGVPEVFWDDCRPRYEFLQSRAMQCGRAAR